MPSINCQVVIEGRQTWWPLQLRIENDKYFVVIGRDSKKEDILFEIDQSLCDKPHDGQAAWNYRGILHVSHRKP
jgi:hypothetical protein